MHAAIYARVSTKDQNCQMQLDALRQYAAAYGWQTTEYVDHGQSGGKTSRPALDAMLAALHRREHHIVAVWKLDRLGRSVKHLVEMVDLFKRLGVQFISVQDGLNTTGSEGRLLFHIMAALAEFERELIRERISAGMRSAQAKLKHGPYRRSDNKVVSRIGRPPLRFNMDVVKASVAEIGIKATARKMGLHESTIRLRLKKEKHNGQSSQDSIHDHAPAGKDPLGPGPDSALSGNALP